MAGSPHNLAATGHVLLLRDGMGSHEETVAAWLRRGVADGAHLMLPDPVGADPASTAVEVLREHSVDLPDALASGQLRILPADVFYVPRQLRRWVGRALDKGYPSVRLLCTVASALTVLTAAQYFLFDSAVQELCDWGLVAALCGYDPDSALLDLDDVVEHHPDAMTTADLHVATASGSVLTLTGSIDLLNSDALGSALRAATARPAAVVSLDLRHVEFISGSGCRTLVTATADFRRSGGYILLVAPRPAIERVLRLAGLDGLPGLEITT